MNSCSGCISSALTNSPPHSRAYLCVSGSTTMSAAAGARIVRTTSNEKRIRYANASTAYAANRMITVTPCRPTNVTLVTNSVRSASTSRLVASITLSLSALLASIAICTSGTAKLISSAASMTRGRRTRRTNWLRIVVRPHIMRKLAQVITAVSAELATTWISGAKVRIGPTLVNGSLGSDGFPVRKMNSRSASITSRAFSTTNAWTFPPRSTARRMASRACSRSDTSVARHRTREHVHQRARHLDADRADHDALDPLLRLQHRLRLDSQHFPKKCNDERERADRADQRLTDDDPAGEDVLNGLDLGRHGKRPPECLSRRSPR